MSYKEKYSSIIKDIESLLPKAFTAGLSAVFSSKKNDEIASSVYLQTSFNTGINFLPYINGVRKKPGPILLSFQY
jgi:hypothetical protein